MPWKILCVAGARPNFIKIAPVLRAFARDPRFDARLVHTGQHYDAALSAVFFDDLRIAAPDVELEVGSGSHAEQTAEVLRRFERVLESDQPHGVLVVGDVNSTIGCALATAKFRRAEPFLTASGPRRRPLVIHVEAGLRSLDRDMPEEINRVLTDAISDVLFVSEPAGMTNLAREGITGDRVQLVGNVMIDTLVEARARAGTSRIVETLGLVEGRFGLVTLHRPSNVDELAVLRELIDSLGVIAAELPLVFPVHPRTRAQIAQTGHDLDPARWRLLEPVGYLDFLRLQEAARVVLTDSGGVQEETTVLGVPCITLRDSTERPVTCELGTNQVSGTRREAILAAYARIDQVRGAARIPVGWDGHAATRIVDALGQLFG